eukprot:6150932-Amphidinium_carterae.1
MCMEGTLATCSHSGICAKANMCSQGEDNPLTGLVEARRAQTPPPCGFCNACEHIQRIRRSWALTRGIAKGHDSSSVKGRI